MQDKDASARFFMDPDWQGIRVSINQIILHKYDIRDTEGGIMSSLQVAAFPNCRSELPRGGTKETFNTS